ncbi:MAG: class I SAM-dependent methyltransferase [Actinomycetota bacterium]|nr:class I SAM-dependent methyltransferase [Actinomycetota bacterium]
MGRSRRRNLIHDPRAARGLSKMIYSPLVTSERRLTLREMLPDDLSVLQGEGPSVEGPLCAPAGMVVLDYGAGDSSLREMVESHGHSYFGIDPYSESTQLRGTGEALPFRADSFDIVISNAVFEHLLDPVVGVGEIARVLKDGGMLTGYAAYLENFHEISYHHLSHKALEYLFSTNGMQLLRLKASASSFDYQLATLLLPVGRPVSLVRLFRRSIHHIVRFIMKAQAGAAALKHHRLSDETGADYRLRLDLLELKFAAGYDFLARKGPSLNDEAIPVTL